MMNGLKLIGGKHMVRDCLIFCIICTCLTKFASDTTPRIAKEDENMGIKEKLNQKKWYTLILTEEGEYNTTLRIPTFDRIDLECKQMNVFEDEGIYMVGHSLKLSKDEVAIFKAVYKNYILRFKPVEDLT